MGPVRGVAAFTLLAAVALVGTTPAAADEPLPDVGSDTSAPAGGTAQEAERSDEERLTRRERRVLRLSASVEPGSAEGAAVEQTGWWSRANEEPPETNALATPSLPAPDVPEGGLPVTVAGGERVRVSAVGITVEGETGDSVDELLLVLDESDAPGSALNADNAVVRACQITTDFWVASTNGKWARVPAHDCQVGAAEGVRDPESGTWAFDLTAMASGWLSEDFTGSHAVLLEAVTSDASGAPAESQVVYDSVEGIGLRASTSPGLDMPSDDEDASTTEDTTSGGAGALGSTGGSSSGGAGGGPVGSATTGGSGALGSSGGTGGSSAALPTSGGSDAVLPDTSAAASDGAVPEAAASADPAAFAPVSSAPRPWYGGLGSGAVLLTALAMGLAYLTMLAMGPDAQPVPATTTRRGVSRALDRMRAMGSGVRAKVGR